MPTAQALLRSCVLFAALSAPLCATAQVTLVSYTFTGDTIVPQVGASLSQLSWNSGSSVGFADTFSSQGRALSVGGFQNGEYYQVTVDAVGFQGLKLEAFRSNGGTSAPVNWQIQLSTTGASGNFASIGSYSIVSGTATNTTTFGSLLLGSAADNNPSLVLRFVATSATRVDSGAGAANGTVRLDNISITGTAIPEPSTYAAIVGLIALLGAELRRRRRAGRTA